MSNKQYASLEKTEQASKEVLTLDNGYELHIRYAEIPSVEDLARGYSTSEYCEIRHPNMTEPVGKLTVMIGQEVEPIVKIGSIFDEHRSEEFGSMVYHALKNQFAGLDSDIKRFIEVVWGANGEAYKMETKVEKIAESPESMSANKIMDLVNFMRKQGNASIELQKSGDMPPPPYEHIAQIESSGHQKRTHPMVNVGVHKDTQSISSYGLMPKGLQELAQKHPPFAGSATGAKIKNLSDPTHVAQVTADHTHDAEAFKHTWEYNQSRIAKFATPEHDRQILGVYAHRRGVQGTFNTLKTKGYDAVLKDPYVQKFLNLKNAGLQKSLPPFRSQKGYYVQVAGHEGWHPIVNIVDSKVMANPQTKTGGNTYHILHGQTGQPMEINQHHVTHYGDEEEVLEHGSLVKAVQLFKKSMEVQQPYNPFKINVENLKTAVAAIKGGGQPQQQQPTEMAKGVSLIARQSGAGQKPKSPVQQYQQRQASSTPTSAMQQHQQTSHTKPSKPPPPPAPFSAPSLDYRQINRESPSALQVPAWKRNLGKSFQEVISKRREKKAVVKD